MRPGAPRAPITASILAVGTELTTGQVTNRNAAWIGAKLTDLGVEVALHETVADDRGAIRSALDRCTAVTQIVFVTGGLGPTRDDFTREVVAEWLSAPLEYDDASWRLIQERLGRFGVRVAESNRQQCYYPRGARVIPNPRGTAQGFSADHTGGARVWVLPGPPLEVSACWDSGIEDELRAWLPAETRALKLLTWQCLGKSEAELGELTEAALAGSGLAIGYRAHRPYIEIKVWVPEDAQGETAPHLERLEKAIAPWIASRMGEEPCRKLLSLLARAEEVELIDSVSGGLMTERLGAFLRLPEFAEQAGSMTLVTYATDGDAPLESVQAMLAQADPEALTLGLAGISADGTWALGLREGQSIHAEALHSPYKLTDPEVKDRVLRYVVEMTILKWCEWLGQGVN